MISGIIFVIRNALRWRDVPREYGPHKTIYHGRSVPIEVNLGLDAFPSPADRGTR